MISPAPFLLFIVLGAFTIHSFLPQIGYFQKMKNFSKSVMIVNDIAKNSTIIPRTNFIDAVNGTLSLNERLFFFCDNDPLRRRRSKLWAIVLSISLGFFGVDRCYCLKFSFFNEKSSKRN